MRNKLRAARDRQELTQAQVAAHLELTQSAYSRIEAGAPTTTTHIERVAVLLGISVADAMENTETQSAADVPADEHDNGGETGTEAA